MSRYLRSEGGDFSVAPLTTTNKGGSSGPRLTAVGFSRLFGRGRDHNEISVAVELPADAFSQDVGFYRAAAVAIVAPLALLARRVAERYPPGEVERSPNRRGWVTVSFAHVHVLDGRDANVRVKLDAPGEVWDTDDEIKRRAGAVAGPALERFAQDLQRAVDTPDFRAVLAHDKVVRP